MIILNYFIPAVSLLTGIILFIKFKANKNLVLNYKSYLINLNAKNFLITSPLLFAITFIARIYCLHFTRNSLIFDFTLLLIQLMVIINFTFISNITAKSDYEENDKLACSF